MTDAVPDIEVIGVESVTLEDGGTVALIKLETETGFVVIRMPVEQAVELLHSEKLRGLN
jgi:hypothetical protein